MPESLDLQIRNSGLNFSDETTELWKAYLESDELEIEEIKRKIEESESLTAALEAQLNDKNKLREKITKLKETEKIESMVEAWWLRRLVFGVGLPKESIQRDYYGRPLPTIWPTLKKKADVTTERYSISKKTIDQINMAIETQELKKNSSLREFSVFQWKIIDKDWREQAKNAIMLELEKGENSQSRPPASMIRTAGHDTTNMEA